jgi:hypothetical protein
MAKHAMIDLETLSTRKDAAIVQLAAVSFDPDTGEIFGRYKTTVLPREGEHVDVGTIAWWLQQDAAKALGAALVGPGCLPLAAALVELWAFFDAEKPEAVWSHGSSFDVAIVEHHCARLELAVPWTYKMPRDTRTLYSLAPGGCPVVEVDAARKHDALYDCEVQIQQVCGALHELELAKAAYERHRTNMGRPCWIA